MLTVTVKPGQRIMIGPDVVVVARVAGAGRVQIGIEAPREVLVLREELVTDEQWQRWEEEKERSDGKDEGKAGDQQDRRDR